MASSFRRIRLCSRLPISKARPFPCRSHRPRTACRCEGPWDFRADVSARNLDLADESTGVGFSSDDCVIAHVHTARADLS